MALKYFLAAIALFLPAAASAQWMEHNDDENCRIVNTWELGTVVIISKSKQDTPLTGPVTEDGIVVTLWNENWSSLRSGDEAKLADFELKFEGDNGESFWGTPYIMNNGLMLTTELRYLRYFRMTNGVEITKSGDQVASLDWGAFYTALPKFERCISETAAPIIEERRKRELRESTPIDPFAN